MTIIPATPPDSALAQQVEHRLKAEVIGAEPVRGVNGGVRTPSEWLRWLLCHFFGWGCPEPVRPKISLLVPYRRDRGQRERVWNWTRRYWAHELPDAEIVIGHSRSHPFSKTAALNDAARHAHGRILVILDSDAYLRGSTIERAADRILEELAEGEHLWVVPYRHLWRLNKAATDRILASDPADPLRLPNPPSHDDIDGSWQRSSYGHRYGAMCMILPREALDVLGCFDERFKGWGGEDVSLLRALDTLWGKHHSVHAQILHLWHPLLGSDYKSRAWKGQKGKRNDRLALAYHRASRKPALMRALVDAGCEYARRRKWRR